MSRVTFNNNGIFFNTLRDKVNHYFVSNKVKMTGNRKLYVKTGILFFFLVTLYVILVFFTPPVWLSVILCSVLGFNIACIGFNVMHDGAHGSFSSKPWVNNIMAYTLNMVGGNAYFWKAKHNVVHHSFTNIEGVDEDIDIRPWMRTNESQPKYWFHRFQHIYWVILYGTTYFLWIFVQDFKKYFAGKVGSMKIKKMDMKEHLIFWLSKIGYITVFIVLPIFMVGLKETLIGYAIITFVCGFIISVVFQLAHIVNDTQFPVPVTGTNKIEEEWAVHQVVTTANFATKSKIVSWFTGGLNYQVEHHLFPRISHIHYPQISRLVKETCQQFNIEYIEYPTFLSALRSHVVYLKTIGA